MSVRSRYSGNRRPAKKKPEPKPKKTALQKTKAALNRLAGYMQKNLEDAHRCGDTTFEQDMGAIVGRVGSHTSAHGKTERERILAMCRRDTDDEICRYFTNRPKLPANVEFVVEREKPRQQKRKRPSQRQVVERIIYVER